MLFTILPTNLRVPSSGNNPLRTVFGFLLVHSLENLCSSTSQKVAKYRTEPPCRTIALNRGHGKPHSTVTKCQGSMITLPTPTRERGVAWVPFHEKLTKGYTVGSASCNGVYNLLLHLFVISRWMEFFFFRFGVKITPGYAFQ